MLAWFSLAFIFVSLISALGGLFFFSPDFQWAETLADKHLWRIVRFTLWQASLSTLLSLLLAMPFASALARQPSFWGRDFILRLSSITLVIPSMVAVFGIAMVYGRNGWFNQGLAGLGLIETPFSLYGLNGILIAHIFFNMPLATRVFLQSIQTLPPETWRLASQLGLSPLAQFKMIEWPLLRSVMPSVAALIFMLCFTSFAIVLTLGGGPKSSTLEVAIYQAIRFDFDLAKGAVLACLQIGIGLVLLLIFRSGQKPFNFTLSSKAVVERAQNSSSSSLFIDVFVIALAAVFLLSPLLALFMRALNSELLGVIKSASFLQALNMSFIISLGAGLLAIILSLPMAFLAKNLNAKNRQRQMYALKPQLLGLRLIDLGSTFILLVPPLTFGMGLFLLLRPIANVFDIGVYLVILVNAMLAVPFVVRILNPRVEAIAQQVDRLSLELGIRPWQQVKLIYWPTLRPALAFSLALATTLSLGDMGVIALFGTQDLSTLPLLIYRLFSAYRMDEAAVVAMLLCVICAIVFWAIERLGGKSVSG